MNKKLLQIGLVSLAVMLAALPVFAATLSLSPANVSVKQGQTFNAIVTLDPQGAKDYTAKVELKYPANLLEVKSFTFGNSWMPLSQTGYDLIDNVNGVLIKTAGYANGLTSPATFGTVTFVAKANGTGAVTVGSNTQIFDANSANVFSGSSQIAVVISATAPVTTKQTTPTPSPSASTLSSPLPSATPTATVPVAAQPSGANGFATIGSIVSLGTGSAWVGILVIIVIIVLLVYFLAIRKKKRKY